jgi:serine/threonine-protein kinase ULK/ATG1
MLFEMLYGCPPWPCRSLEAYSEAIRKRPLAFPFDVKVGNETKDFIKKALVVDEQKRLSWQ